MTIPAFLSKHLGLAESSNLLWTELRSNRRVALGLMVIVALVAVSGVVVLRGATDRAEAGYRSQMLMLQRIDAIAGEKDWPQREAASNSLRATLQQRLWAAGSEGLAQAGLQAWIGGVAREVGLPMFDIRIESAKLPTLPADLRQITATITAQPSEPAVIALLERLEQAPHLTVVTRLHVRQHPGPMLEMVLVGYARIGTAGRGDEK